jgi:hypothetical protein
VKRSTAFLKINDILSCDGVLDFSFSGHNSTPMTIEQITEFIITEIECWGITVWDSEDNQEKEDLS